MMGWLDRHKRHGVVPALIALALQIVLAFDHVHVHVHVHGLAPTSSATAAQSVAFAQTKAPAPTPIEDDGYCAICASIFLASSASAPTPPQLPLPANFDRVELSFNAVAAVAQRQHLAFRSRAPPAA
jgi:hypothetical protein